MPGSSSVPMTTLATNATPITVVNGKRAMTNDATMINEQ